MAVPDVLTERADLDLTWTPPTSDEPSVDPARPTLLYHPFRLSAAWREDADANRRVLLEPSWFIELAHPADEHGNDGPKQLVRVAAAR